MQRERRRKFPMTERYPHRAGRDVDKKILYVAVKVLDLIPAKTVKKDKKETEFKLTPYYHA